MNVQKFTKEIRAAAILTGSYVASDIFGSDTGETPQGLDPFNTVTFAFAYTKGSLTNIKVKISGSEDNSTFYPITDTSASGADVTVEAPNVYTNATTGNFHITITDSTWRYYKVEVLGTGTVTGSSVAITGIAKHT